MTQQIEIDKGERKLKERIEQLAAGNVVINMPELDFSPASLEGKIPEGSCLNREMVIRSANKISFKGFFYSTNERVRIGTRQAAGQSAAVLFEINAIDCKAGDVIEGSIIMVGNAGEKQIHYAYTVTPARERERDPETAEAFTELCREDYVKALKLFLSEQFERLPFMRKNVKWMAIYEGLLAGGHEKQALEAFLQAIGQKEPVQLRLGQKSYQLRVSDEPSQAILSIQTDTWGYIRGEISADQNWIVLSRTAFRSGDFSDGELTVPFEIDPSLMRKGRSTGNICIQTERECLKVRVEVICGQQQTANNGIQVPRSVVRYLYQLMLVFLNRSHEETVIFSQMDQCLEENIKKHPGCMELHLYRAWLFIQMGRKREAGAILDWCKATMERTGAEAAREECILVYLYFLLTEKAEYLVQTKALLGQVQAAGASLFPAILQVYLEQEKSVSVLLQELQAMEQQFGASPLIYNLAYQLYTENPAELKQAGSFELRVLSHSIKCGCLTPQMAERFLSLPLAMYGNSKRLYLLMRQMYNYYHDDRVLELICTALIRMGRKKLKDARWYELGIRQGITINQINDYYLCAVSEHMDQQKIPMSILLYYSYKNDLDNQTRLNLYIYILDHFTRESDIYEAYEGQMDEFAIRQLLDGRIDSKLVRMYDSLLSPGLIDEHLAKMLPSLLFSREITTSIPSARQLVVHYPQVKVEHTEKLVNGRASVPVFTEDAAILIEDARGNRFLDRELQQKVLMDRADLVQVCRKKWPDQLMLLTEEADVFYQKPIQKAAQARLAFRLLGSAEIRPTFSRVLTHRMIDYCYQHDADTKEYNGWLLSLRPEDLEVQQRNRLVEMYITRGYSKEAFEAVCTYGSKIVKVELLLRMTVRRITEVLYERNDQLLWLCRKLLEQNQIHETVLTYLCMHYNGSTEDMYQLLLSADDTCADSRDLAERVVAQMMFTGNLEHLDEVYGIYNRIAYVSEDLRKAYLVLKCHDSLQRGSALSEAVVEQIEIYAEKKQNRELVSIFALALLSHYSKKTVLLSSEKRLCETFLYSLSAKGIYMSCYHALGKLVELPHQMEGRVVCQWIGKPGCKVWLQGELSPQKKKITYEMKEIYPGIYSAAVFLFPDETADIEIVCREGWEEKTVEKRVFDASVCYCRSGSIYEDIMNRIQLEKEGAFEQWKTERERSIRRELAVQELFPLL